MYEALTGEIPFPDIDMDLVDSQYRYLITKCTEKKPERRYQTVSEVIANFDTITKGAQVFQSRTVGASAILEEIMSSSALSAEDVSRLDQLLMESQNNQELYHKFFPKLQGSLLDAYLQYSPEGFRRALTQYDKYVSEPLDFSYCDKVAEFYREIYLRVNDPHVRQLILSRLLDIGVGHNRWFVQDVFCKLIGEVEDPSTAFVAIDVVTSNPSGIKSLSEKLLEARPIKIIADAISEVIKDNESLEDEF